VNLDGDTEVSSINDSSTTDEVPDYRTATARSWLLAAATDLSRLADAVETSPDCLIVDLEDGVPHAAKSAARDVAAGWLESNSGWVRINDIRTGLFHHDIAAIRGRAGLAGVVLSKTETAQDVVALALELPGIPIVPMVESARALINALEISSAIQVSRIAFGVGDFLFDTGMANTRTSLAHARSHLVTTSRAAGLPGPIDGPSADQSQLADDTRHGSELGLTGKLMVRGGDVTTVNSVLTPSGVQIEAAKSVIARLGLHGERITTGSDAPRLAAATATLRLADFWGAQKSVAQATPRPR
jgi:citrate lyase subunit beta/citryl-CoA lyase